MVARNHKEVEAIIYTTKAQKVQDDKFSYRKSTSVMFWLVRASFSVPIYKRNIFEKTLSIGVSFLWQIWQ